MILSKSTEVIELGKLFKLYLKMVYICISYLFLSDAILYVTALRVSGKSYDTLY